MRPSPLIQSHYTYKMPYGTITVRSDGRSVTGVGLGKIDYEGEERPDSLTNECASQMLEYMSGKRSVFQIEHKAEGSDFQRRVWSEIEKIPYSHVITYRQLAEILGVPSAYRQVGSAVRANPLAILIPAHRVIPESGYVGKKDSDRIKAAFRELEKRYG